MIQKVHAFIVHKCRCMISAKAVYVSCEGATEGASKAHAYAAYQLIHHTVHVSMQSRQDVRKFFQKHDLQVKSINAVFGQDMYSAMRCIILQETCEYVALFEYCMGHSGVQHMNHTESDAFCDPNREYETMGDRSEEYSFGINYLGECINERLEKSAIDIFSCHEEGKLIAKNLHNNRIMDVSTFAYK